MGIQALAYKFGSFDLEETFFGVNQNGECRVWPSEDLCLIPQESTSSLKPAEVVNFVVGKVGEMINFTHRSLFEKLVEMLLGNGETSYTKIYSEIQKFAKEERITVPSYLSR